MSKGNKNKLEAVLQLGDAFVEEIQKRNTELQTQKAEVTGQSKVSWWKRDRDGQRVTTSKRRKKSSSAVGAGTSPCASSTITTSCTSYQNPDFNMQRLEDLLRDSESIDGHAFAQQPSLSSWCQRQKGIQQCWQQAEIGRAHV